MVLHANGYIIYMNVSINIQQQIMSNRMNHNTFCHLHTEGKYHYQVGKIIFIEFKINYRIEY